MSDHDKKTPRPDEDPLKDLKELLKKKFGGEGFTVMLGMDPEGEAGGEPEPEEARKSRAGEALRFDLSPAQVKAHLDRFVIGQDEAKKTLAVAVCDHYNHVRRVHQAGARAETGDYVKQNVILIGPTGVGKTYLIRTIAQLIGVPFVKADITKFSETGYVGGDVDDLVRELVRMADGDIELAEYGIVFLDEIDKIASASNLMGRDVSGRGVQTGLLKLLEETEVPAHNPNSVSAQFQEFLQMRKGKPAKRTINTRHVLFVVSGAFTGMTEIIEKRLSERSIGFAAATSGARVPKEQLFDNVATRDFVDYGFEPEFIGRLPIRVALRDLTEDDLYQILTCSEGSILKQHRENFLGYGIDVRFDPDSLRAVAAKAIEEKTGARGLMTILESRLRPFKFHLPGTEVKRFVVHRGVVENPGQALERLLQEPGKGEEDFAAFEVRSFEEELARTDGIRLRLDAPSVSMAAAVARDLHLSIPDYLRTVFHAHRDFLKKVQRETGRTEFPVTPQVLNRPEEGVEVWLARR